MKQTGKAKQVSNAFAEVKKTTEKEADYIMNKITGSAARVPADDLEPLVAINIVMTTAKANWDILIHFSSFDSFIDYFCPSSGLWFQKGYSTHDLVTPKILGRSSAWTPN